MPTVPYNPTHINTYGLGCSRFARRYLGNRKNLLPEHNGASTNSVQELVPELMQASVQKESSVYCFLFL